MMIPGTILNFVNVECFAENALHQSVNGRVDRNLLKSARNKEIHK